MTETEPTYHFVKGAGWVPSTHETMSETIGNYKVTLIRRDPEIGEYWFWMKYTETLEDVMTDMRVGWLNTFKRKNAEESMSKYDGRYCKTDLDEFVIVELELELVCP